MASSASFPAPTDQEIIALAFAGQENFMPAAEDSEVGLPHKFLSLAPITSASYPVLRNINAPSQTLLVTEALKSEVVTHEIAETGTPALQADVSNHELLKTRRSSSLNSEPSGSNQRMRFLRLGPVHHGESSAGDWSEVAITE